MNHNLRKEIPTLQGKIVIQAQIETARQRTKSLNIQIFAPKSGIFYSFDGPIQNELDAIGEIRKAETMAEILKEQIDFSAQNGSTAYDEALSLGFEKMK